MKFVTAAQMRRIDRLAIERYGIPSLILMENAGIACAWRAIALKAKWVTLVCGKGNNGGDGFVVARHLHNQGIPCTVFCPLGSGVFSQEASLQLKILQKLRVSILDLDLDSGLKRLRMSFKKSNLIIDAIFGIGLSKPVEGLWAEVIHEINHSRKRVLSIDIPSGLHADSGRPMGGCVRAFETVTLGLPKKGFARGRSWVGNLSVADISLPRRLLQD